MSLSFQNGIPFAPEGFGVRRNFYQSGRISAKVAATIRRERLPIQYDFSSTCRESYAEYLASARSIGASVEVGSLFRIQDVLMRPVDPGPG